MTWIKTVPLAEASDALKRRDRGAAGALPGGVREPGPSHAATATSGIVASHTLIPEALYHAFATFGALMSPDLPLTRRQHEMITTVVSVHEPVPLLNRVSRRVSASRDVGRGAGGGASRRTTGTRRSRSRTASCSTTSSS